MVPARIIHIDLAKGVPQKPLDTGGRPAYLVFWWKGVPLGHYQLGTHASPMPSSQLRNLALQTITPAVGAYVLRRGFEGPLPEYPPADAPHVPPDLQALVALESPMHCLDTETHMRAETVSVIICTRDRTESLDQCLRALMSCSPPPDEIVVVDNSPSTEATRRLVSSYHQVKYVLEPRPGLDVARNTGIRNAGGQILAFTDDDVIVHADWISRWASCFADPSVMAATGLVLPAELETEAQRLFEEHWGFNRGYRVMTYDAQYFAKLKRWGVPAWHIGAGANMAFRREAFDRVGDFDIRLDVGAAGCSGDSEIWYRFLAAGLVCRYDPRAVAFHYHRKDMKGLRRQMYYYMRGHTAALLVQFARHRHWGNLVRLVFLLPLYYGKLIAQGLLQGFSPRHGLVPIECVGCLAGVWFFLRNMRTPIQDSNSAPSS
jgi:GT2 family glycosyltransferase